MMGRKAREIQRLKAKVEWAQSAIMADEEYTSQVEAQRDAAIKRAEAAEAKLKAVRKAMGILEPTTSTGITLQPGSWSTTGTSATFRLTDALHRKLL